MWVNRAGEDCSTTFLFLLAFFITFQVRGNVLQTADVGHFCVLVAQALIFLDELGRLPQHRLHELLDVLIQLAARLQIEFAIQDTLATLACARLTREPVLSFYLAQSG